MGELCDGCEVVVETVEDDLGMGLGEERESSGLVNEA